MKGQRRPEQRRLGSNAVLIGAMLLSLLVLSIVKSKYCSSSFADPDDAGAGASGEGVEDRDDEVEATTAKPACYESSRRSMTCDVAGDVRVVGKSKTILARPLYQEWKVKPYARKHDPAALAFVDEWTIKPLAGAAVPACTKKHNVTAILFSDGGFAGNLYHDYTDTLVPLFITAHDFAGEVELLVTGPKSWWVTKFTIILRQLTNYPVIEVDNDAGVHCFPRLIAGLTFHKDMGIDPSRTATGFSIVDFKAMLRRAFGLERAAAAGPSPARKPRLLIISRKNSRKFLNEAEMVATAMELGFDVTVAEPDSKTEMAAFAKVVNSADVMIGVHGAGLTNMVFLPRGAVVIQVVPFGGLEWLTRVTFKEPATEMEVNYVDYNVRLEESSLAGEYPGGHPVIADPYSVHKKGWDAIKAAYLEKQDVRLDVRRLKDALLHALTLLPSR